jgi:RNA polymerase-binding transcription factor
MNNVEANTEMTSSPAHRVNDKGIFPGHTRTERSIMNTCDIARYTAILQHKEAELLVALRGRGDLAPVSSPDSIEELQLAEVRELEIDSLDRRACLLRKVEDALSRISDGSYGLCRLCDAMIKPARLNAVPWAPLCIDCQEDAERTQGTNGRFLYNAFDDAA